MADMLFASPTSPACAREMKENEWDEGGERKRERVSEESNVEDKGEMARYAGNVSVREESRSCGAPAHARRMLIPPKVDS